MSNMSLLVQFMANHGATCRVCFDVSSGIADRTPQLPLAGRLGSEGSV